MSASSGPPAVTATGLGRRFGPTWALAHVDLDLAFGTSLWLRGSNGAGKTTLLRMLATLSTPSCGTLEVAGIDAVKERESVRRTVSLISHSLYLYPGLTALETLGLWMRLGQGGVDGERAHRLLDEVGLTAAANRRVGQFSAGMRKRLAVARTRIEEPRILLLDEPFSSLDTAGCELIEDWVRAFVEAGGTVIMASHDHERSQSLCELVIDLVDGQIAGSGRTG